MSKRIRAARYKSLLASDETRDTNPPPIVGKRRPGPKQPNYGILPEHWPIILHRVVDINEPLRKVADEYGVSHETIRRITLHGRQAVWTTRNLAEQ